MFVYLFRTTQYALQHFWRNLWISAITIFILTLTLFIVGLVGSLNILVKQAIQAVENKVDVDLYFKADTYEADILKAKLFLESLDQVTAVRYTSKQDALNNFAASHSADPEIQEALGQIDDNPLPASLSVQATDLSQYQNVVDKFESSDFNKLVEDKNFSDHQTVIDQLSTFTRRLYLAGVAVSGIFILISVIMMYNTIRMAIYSHRQELGIMKLVGATNGFIRAPFVIEGGLYALIASLLAMIIMAVVVYSVAPYVDSFFVGYEFSLSTFL